MHKMLIQIDSQALSDYALEHNCKTTGEVSDALYQDLYHLFGYETVAIHKIWKERPRKSTSRF